MGTGILELMVVQFTTALNGRNGVVIDTDSRFGRAGHIAISTNGYHIGTLIDGIAHWNAHPQGLPLEAWFNSFY